MDSFSTNIEKLIGERLITTGDHSQHFGGQITGGQYDGLVGIPFNILKGMC